MGEEKMIEGIKLSRDAAIVAGTITGNEWLVEKARKMKDEEVIDMCEALERYTRETFAEGKTEGQVQMIIQQLTKKLGNLSNMIIEKLQNSTSEKINILAISIFDIESEDDILQIIH